MKSPYMTTTNYYNYTPYISNNPPKFNISTEPHYKIRKYIEQDNIKIPNKNLLKKIISTAINKQKYQGKMNLNNPGNKDVLADSDSEEFYNNINESNMKYINKKMLKQNGCAKLIIKKIESQTPQRNEEYYKFNNNNNKYLYRQKDPIYGSKTISNWNYKYNKNNEYNNNIIRNNNLPEKEDMIYIKTNPNENNDSNKYNSSNKKINTSDSKTNNNNINNNFNSNMDLNYITFNKYNNNNIKQNINDNNNNQSYESSEDAEYGSSSYIYYPTKIKTKFNNNNNINNKIINKNLIKENDFSSQSISYNDDYNKYKNIEKLKAPPKIIKKNKLSLQQLIKLNYNNNNGTSILQKKFNDKLIKNVIKIQSIWKGYYTRENITKNLKKIKFIYVIIEIIWNKYLDYFEEFFNIIKYKEKIKKYKIESVKNENYDDLLKDYKLLLNKYDKLEKEMNELKNLNKKNNSFDNLNIIKDENNFEIMGVIQNTNNEINKNKIFDIIQKEKKDEFSILKIKNNIEKTPNIIINSEHFMIKENNKKNIKEKLNFIDKNQCLEIKGKKQKNNVKDKSSNKFKSNDLIIVKKSKFNINKKINENIEKDTKKNQIQNYLIDKNALYIKKSKINKINVKENKNNINYNPIIEIDKKESLEINPLEIKKYIINKNNKPFMEKAKNKILKMLLPVKIKSILQQKVKKEIMKNLKEYKK